MTHRRRQWRAAAAAVQSCSPRFDKTGRSHRQTELKRGRYQGRSCQSFLLGADKMDRSDRRTGQKPPREEAAREIILLQFLD